MYIHYIRLNTYYIHLIFKIKPNISSTEFLGFYDEKMK